MTIEGRTRIAELERYINELLTLKRKIVVPIRFFCSHSHDVGFRAFVDEFTRDGRAGLCKPMSGVEVYIVPMALQHSVSALRGVAVPVAADRALLGFIISKEEGPVEYTQKAGSPVDLDSPPYPGDPDIPSGVVKVGVVPTVGIGFQRATAATPAPASSVALSSTLQPPPRSAPSAVGASAGQQQGVGLVGTTVASSTKPVVGVLVGARAAYASGTAAHSASGTFATSPRASMVTTPSSPRASGGFGVAPSSGLSGGLAAHAAAVPSPAATPPVVVNTTAQPPATAATGPVGTSSGPADQQREVMLRVAAFCAQGGPQTMDMLKGKENALKLMPFLFEGQPRHQEFRNILLEILRHPKPS